MVKNSIKVTPSCASSPDLNMDIEAQVELDVCPIHNLSSKDKFTDIDPTNERVDLSLRESTNGVLTYNIFLQFTSSSIPLNQVSLEYYYFRHTTITWQSEYCFAAVSLGYYLVVGNIEEMFFLEKTNVFFLLSFLCVILSTIFAILSRLVVGSTGLIVTRAQLCESLVFFSVY